MQITEFLRTTKWLNSLYSESTKSLMFSHDLSRFLINLRHGIPKDSLGDVGGVIGAVLKATNEMAVVRISLVSDPFAAEVLKAFHLEDLLSDSFPTQIAEKSITTLTKVKESDITEEVIESLGTLGRNWNLLQSTVTPLQKLLVPNEIAGEKDFDDILTIELRYEHEHSPQAETISEILTNIEQLYAAVAISLGERNYRPLAVLYVASGTSFRFDFTGLGEPIREIKELLVEAWTRLRHRKADDLHQNNKVLLGSLEVLRHIEADAKQNVLDPEEALRLREQVIKNTIALFEAGALPREIPNEEIVSNRKLLQGIQVKLLPPQPSEKGENADLSKPTKKRKRRIKRKKSSVSSAQVEPKSNGD